MRARTAKPKGHRERRAERDMSDLLEETISLSDLTDITETEGPGATQQTRDSTVHSYSGNY
jgi:hypothetical protein